MTCRAGLADLAIRYQRQADIMTAEAEALRTAIERAGEPVTADQRLMMRRYDAAAKSAADMARMTLDALLFFTDDVAPRRAA